MKETCIVFGLALRSLFCDALKGALFIGTLAGILWVFGRYPEWAFGALGALVFLTILVLRACAIAERREKAQRSL